jgi:hypothetical protein
MNVDTGRVPRKVYRMVTAALEDARAANDGAGRFRTPVSVDDYGRAHGPKWFHKGAYDADRLGTGIAKGDARALGIALRKAGMKVTDDEADALLAQAVMGYLVCVSLTPEQEREKKKRRRAWARANGICIICCKIPVPEGYTTCQECRERNAGYVQASRERAKDEAS